MTFFRNFDVTGSGPFPYDMLRYDGCFPLRQHDVTAMADSDGRRTVRLRCIDRTKGATIPTYDRWRSFGWEPDCSDDDAERL